MSADGTATIAKSRAEGKVLSAVQLTVGYQREVVVEGIDLGLEPGKTLALVGSNGSGKSTFLKTIAGLLPPLAGSLEVLGGKPLGSPADVAYMGQFQPSTGTLPLRAIDVVRMARFARRGLVGRMRAEDEEAVRRAMDVMGVTQIARAPLNTLSGGQRQRVFIAQAFAREAKLILLDEPATNLDAHSRETYRRMIGEAVSAGASIVIATHDIEEATACDYALLLARKVVAFGPGCKVLRAETLMSTFGIVGHYTKDGTVVVEREHGHDCE
ncbi:MAG TPA: ATP-binding cassette domain-containing protein [Rectinemataceae bacterium]|nr:ATP-binding cassette domain-containing protein [Rectinemataceae bacterium]